MISIGSLLQAGISTSRGSATRAEWRGKFARDVAADIHHLQLSRLSVSG
jgi:hypothetical protein